MREERLVRHLYMYTYILCYVNYVYVRSVNIHYIMLCVYVRSEGC
jgi:hypothetical protein